MRRFLCLLMVVSMAIAEEPVTVTKCDGGSVTTSLGEGISVNAKSSLRREFVAIHDPSLPILVDETPGATMVYREAIKGYMPSGYEYRSKLNIKPSNDIAAIEARFVTFDIWGDHAKTLLLTEIRDMASGQDAGLYGTWDCRSESECSEYMSCIFYISRVRTKDGRVLKASAAALEAVLKEARRYNGNATLEKLEPKPVVGASI